MPSPRLSPFITLLSVTHSAGAEYKRPPPPLHRPRAAPLPLTMSSHLVDECAAPPKNCFRLVVLGTARVGKTAIVSRFLFNQYDDQYTPTIEDFHRKMYRIRGEVYRLDILDTSGVHPFPAMRRLSFLTGGSCLFLCLFVCLCGCLLV